MALNSAKADLFFKNSESLILSPQRAIQESPIMGKPIHHSTEQ
jgi:hypothetical protein